MTLTARLRAFFVGTVAAVLAGFSVALYLLAERHLARQLDDDLMGTLNTLEAAAELDPDGIEWDRDRRRLQFRRVHDHAVRWTVRAAGPTSIDRSDDSPDYSLLPPFDETSPERFDHTDSDGRTWKVGVRVLGGPPFQPRSMNPLKHRHLTLVAAVDAGPLAATLRTLAAALVGVSIAVLALVGVAAGWICRRALHPVSTMAAEAGAIRAETFDARLSLPTVGDELSGLGTSFNSLLDRLQDAYERQRQFAGNASHQLRTPLAGLLGQVEVALRHPRDEAEYRRVLETVQQSGRKLSEILESLLFLTRADAEQLLAHRERIELGQWLAQRLADQWRTHPRYPDLRFGADGMVEVAVVPALLSQAVDNVLDNAFKYSEPGTPVTMEVRQTAGAATIAIEDRGMGVGAVDRDRLFLPFFRGEEARLSGTPGFGLGLAVANRIVAAFGGSICLDPSNAISGTRVTIALPATSSESR